MADGPSLSIVIPVSAGSGARMTAARWTLTALAALLVLAYVPLSPAYPSNPNRDAGLFLYAGSEILHGGVPYRDVWDHKPPLIFYLNALGLALAPGWWGVWVLELLMMGGALYASWRILHGFGALPAAVGCAVWICGVFVCSIAGRGGDLTENYALPLQFAAILLWSTGAVAAPRAAVLLGLLCAGAFLLKPPLIGTWIAIGLLALAETRQWKWIAYAALGFVVPLAAFTVYFAAQRALPDAIDQIFRYNSAYTATATTAGRMHAARWAGALSLAFGAHLALLYWPVAAVRWRNAPRVVRFAVVALPIEFLLACLPGRTYEHYFIALLPSMAILTAAGLALLRPLAPARHQRAAGLAIVLVALILQRNALSDLRLALMARSNGAFVHAVRRDAAASFVRRSTKPGETVLIWGAEASVNFLSGRRSPTRYAYLHPLMTTGYGDAARVREFLRALRDHPPAMIVDTSPTEPLFPPIDDASRRRWRPWPEYVPPAQFAEVIAWVNEHYTLDAVLRASGWKIYVPRGDGGKR